MIIMMMMTIIIITITILRHWVRPRGRCCSRACRFPLPASRKEEKYANIGSQYLFAPIAVETLGPLNTSACQLFGNLGRKISSSSGDDREEAFLFQRVSVLVQRFNAVLLHDSLPTPDCTDDRSVPNFVYLNF